LIKVSAGVEDPERADYGWVAGDINAYDRLQIILPDAETRGSGQIWQQCAECVPPLALCAGDCIAGKQPSKILPKTTIHGIFQGQRERR
jgi:hypothetical protein